MEARYHSTCSFCQREIIAGKHRISLLGKKWVHEACVEASNNGIEPIEKERTLL